MLRETLPFSPLSARYRPTVYHLRPPDYSLLTKLSTTPVIQNIPTFPSLSNTTAPSCNTHPPDDLTHISSHADPSNFSGERRAGRKRERYRRKLRVDGQADSDGGRGPSSDLPAAGSAAGPTDINDRSQNISQDLRIQMSLARSRTYTDLWIKVRQLDFYYLRS